MIFGKEKPEESITYADTLLLKVQKSQCGINVYAED